MLSFNSFIDEAESGTANARQIFSTLKKSGYKKLGSGADATVWSKDEGSVLKIIMPEEGENATSAVKTFLEFYNFCKAHKNIKCLPRFNEIGGEGHARFEINGKEYLQVSMEKLKPIKRNTIEEMMVWILSDFATKNIEWAEVAKQLPDPVTWGFDTSTNKWRLGATKMEKSMPEKLKDIVQSPAFYRDYGLLFIVMRLLYVTGKINKAGWDLHTENVMQRSDGTLVIVDPWFNIEENK